MIPVAMGIQAAYMGQRRSKVWISGTIGQRLYNIFFGAVSSSVMGFIFAPIDKVNDSFLIAIMMIAAGSGAELYTALVSGLFEAVTKRLEKAIGGDRNDHSD